MILFIQLGLPALCANWGCLDSSYRQVAKGAIQDDVVEMGTVPITKNAPFLELSENDDWRLPLSWEASDSLDREDCIEDAYRLIELYLTVA